MYGKMSSSLVNKEMQFETVMRHYFFVNKMGKDKNKKVTISIVCMNALKQALSYLTQGCIYHWDFPKGTLQ